MLGSWSYVAFMEIRSIIGQNVRGFRELQGYSREELCKRTRLHLNYLGAIERGEKNVTVDTLNRIAIVLGIDPFALLIPRSYQWAKRK